ncbi:MAG: PEP-CTERM sorting domain-containing protein [Burkholderiales bacterium]|nr:PEP-CTERM sorting domain-containing protein [Burkholderiales bacterium]
MKSVCKRTLAAMAVAGSFLGTAAQAGVVFSDLGPAPGAYNAKVGWAVTGSGSFGGTSFYSAHEFEAGGVGNLSISRIDLGISVIAPGDGFDVGLWTDNAGMVGSELASWKALTTLQDFGKCCELLTIDGISGLTLTGGQSYFLVLAPHTDAGASDYVIALNNQGVKGGQLYSSDGGTTWRSNGSQTIGAFDIVSRDGTSVPEPATLPLLGVALIGLWRASQGRSRR